VNGERVKVLLVEDDEDDVVLTRQLFADIEGGAYEVEWVADYDKGLERACSGEYDVCLVDYRLGERDGVEFIREAVLGACHAPIILLTGQGDRAVDVAAMNAGAADFLNKGGLRATDLERSVRYAMQHKRAEEERIKLFAEQARRAEAEAENRAKDQFLAALSHELRTPLTPVLFTVEDLEQEADMPERLRESLALIKRNVQLEARLIDDLLDLTRVAHRKLEVRREVVDVHAQLRHAVDTCGFAVGEGQVSGKRLKVHVRVGAARHHAVGDPARLQQVFWNLIKNAIKFTPDGGRIDIRTRNEGDQTVAVEVKDTGIGIEPAALARVFNAFEQAERRQRGSRAGRDVHRPPAGGGAAEGLTQESGASPSCRCRGSSGRADPARRGPRRHPPGDGPPAREAGPPGGHRGRRRHRPAGRPAGPLRPAHQRHRPGRRQRPGPHAPPPRARARQGHRAQRIRHGPRRPPQRRSGVRRAHHQAGRFPPPA
jgi:signal transduction histidine kinase